MTTRRPLQDSTGQTREATIRNVTPRPGQTPKRVVRFSFRPAIVEVPPMRDAIIEARFDAPPKTDRASNYTARSPLSRPATK